MNLGSLTGRIDASLGRLPMYRVVSLVLAALAAYALVLIGTERLTVFASLAEAAAALAVVLVISVVANLLLGAVFNVRAHSESAVITGLLLWFLLLPPTTTAGLAWIATTAIVANASKYLIAVRGRHIVNPAAAGIVIVFAVQHFLGESGVVVEGALANGWWIANSAMVWPVALGALVVLVRTRRVDLGVVFVALAGLLVVLGQVNLGSDVGAAVRFALVSSPTIFLAGFMLSEPLTLPPRRGQQLGVAALAAVVFAWPSFASIFVVDPGTPWFYALKSELALVATGVVAFVLGQRGGVRLRLTGRRHLAGDTWELRFAPRRPLRFVPGQYLELALPHRRPDLRGVRRTFSIASPLTDGARADEVAVALRVPEPCSSFKRALLELEPGTDLRATGVGGDFVLRRGAGVLVAGGIGITPFLAQLRSGHDADLVLIYGVADAEQVPYAEEIAATGVPVVLVSPEAPKALPPGWRHVSAAVIDGEIVADAVPDLASRTAYISGPPPMVAALRSTLRRRAARVRTDAFAGY